MADRRHALGLLADHEAGLVDEAHDRQVEGVAEVASIGGYVKQYQIEVDPDQLRYHDIPLNQVIAAVKASNIDVGARSIEINKAEYLIRGLGFIKNIEDIGKILGRGITDTELFYRIYKETLKETGRV